MTRLPSSPLNSVEPSPGRKIPAHSAAAIRNAFRRFTCSFCNNLLSVGKLFFIFLAIPLLAQESVKPRAEHVVLVIWDGMRPDFIREDLTPNAAALAKSGTFFAKNHSTYITSTEGNGSVLATGMLPRNNGIIANREYRPEVNLIKPVDTQYPWPVRVGDAVHSGRWMLVPTIAETVRKAGFTAAVAGTKGIGLLHDRSFDRTPFGGAPIVFEGQAYPNAFGENLTTTLGKWPGYPKEIASNTAQNLWTTRALLEHLWKNGVPKYSVLWLGDPDFTQHLTSPGHPAALDAIRDSDTHLGMMLAELQKHGVREKTDVFLVSDHGFSTVERTVDFSARLRAHGMKAKVPFRAVGQFKQTPKQGEVITVGVGGSTLIYVVNNDPAIIAEIVEWLQGSDFVGGIFTRDGAPGTFKLSDVWMDSPTPPDIAFSFTWSDRPNKAGVRGSLTAEGRQPGNGTHASLSRFDIHNTLIAAGPDIRAGLRSELPSGNIDVAPTIYHCLGIAPPQPLDGRVLIEALAASVKKDFPAPVTKRIEASRQLPSGKEWKQWLQFTTFGNNTYLDEGNSNAAE